VTLRRVLVVNTADRGGGAERVAMNILDGFTRLGTDTWLAVADKRTDHPRVVPVHATAQPGLGARARRRAVEVRRRIDRRLGLEDLAHWSTRNLLELAGAPPDLILCNNLHGGYFDLRELPRLSRRLPVVLRVADSWAFTGHCAVPPGCPRWEHGCGDCPDLATPPAVRRDLTAYNWHRKRRILAGAQLHVVAPSRWLMDRARRSLIGSSIASSRVVANGVDTVAFAPGPAEPARDALGVDRNAAVLVYVSNLGAANPHKDFATLRRAMRRLADRLADRPLELLVVGAEGADEPLGGGARIRHLPYLAERERLAVVYRAADLYVHAAGDEAFCLSAAEALSCGRAVVAAAAGGLPEVVEHGRTGLIERPGDDSALADAVEHLLADRERREGMGVEAARIAREKFDADLVIDELHAWCADIVAGRQGAHVDAVTAVA
jgi:glycosyltransferase involved in cell wall biosynthesis